MTNLRTTRSTHRPHPGAAPRQGFAWGLSLTLAALSSLALAVLGGCEGELDLSGAYDAGQRSDGQVDQALDGGAPGQDADSDVQGGDDAGDAQDAAEAPDAQGQQDDASAREDASAEPDDQSDERDEDDAQVDVEPKDDIEIPPEPKDDGERMPVIVAAGSNHQLALSVDDGRSWCLTHEDNSLTGFDNAHLLRNVTFANGYFVAGSWEGLYRSRNGYEWEDVLEQSDTPDKPAFNQWIAQVDYGNGWWVATGGAGTAMRSKDLVEWWVTDLPGGNAARSLAFGNGKFVTGRDGDEWWQSTDGETWTLLGAGSTALIFDGEEFRDSPGYDCARDRDTCMRPQWGKPFQRSEDGGTSWTTIPAAMFPNNTTRFAFGEAPVSDFAAGADLSDALRSCLGL